MQQGLLRRLIQPAIMTLTFFGILIGLGVWQVQRLNWKDHLLSAIDQANERAPAQLNTSPLPFERVLVEGHWLASTARYGAEVRDTTSGPRMGSQLVGFLARPGLPAVMVLLGWVVDDVPVALPANDIRLVGYVRPQDHRSWLSAGDNAVTHRFFTLDPVTIGRTFFMDVEPFTVVALQAASSTTMASGLEPIPATQLPRPDNNHLSYAVTWFGLAATLLVVFGVWVRRQISA